MSPAMTPETTQPAMTGTPKIVQSTSENFASELQSFFVLCLMNLVFGSLAMAFGMQFIVTAVLAMAAAGTFQWFPAFQVLLGWAAAVVGLRWIVSTAKILKGVTKIHREYRAMGGKVSRRILREPASGESPAGPVSPEALTGLIIRMIAHYRENWKAIWRMNLISTLGGAVFLTLGVVNIVDGILAWYSPLGFFYLPVFLAPFIAGAINLTIGGVSLLFSSWFRRYARAWDHRLIETSHSEEALKHAMEQE
ncbi:MAG: hypothetical protein LUQ32_07365 [Methanomicrobiales archaeon]|nr:hypothetical protein [Methanomicrobiales archaeon]